MRPCAPLVIHEVLREEGEFELRRPPAALLWSGLAAGLSMGFSFLTLALLQAYLPDQPWRPVLASFGYCVGFVIVVLGKQQLFTETTLTAMLPVLLSAEMEIHRHPAQDVGDRAPSQYRGNARVRLSSLEARICSVRRSSGAVSQFPPTSLSDHFIPTTLKAMLAGWMIALMVWVLPSAGFSGLFVIVLMTYVISLGHFSHIVAGSTEAAFAVFDRRRGHRRLFRAVLSADPAGQFVRRGRVGRSAQSRACRA